MQNLVEKHLKDLIVKNFDPKKADSIFSGAGQVLRYLLCVLHKSHEGIYHTISKTVVCWYGFTEVHLACFQKNFLRLTHFNNIFIFITLERCLKSALCSNDIFPWFWGNLILSAYFEIVLCNIF